MKPERKARLGALEWWVWNTLDAAWHTKFDELVAFYAANGRCPAKKSTPGGLGAWVNAQRSKSHDDERRA